MVSSSFAFSAFFAVIPIRFTAKGAKNAKEEGRVPAGPR